MKRLSARAVGAWLPGFGPEPGDYPRAGARSRSARRPARKASPPGGRPARLGRAALLRQLTLEARADYAHRVNDLGRQYTAGEDLLTGAWYFRWRGTQDWEDEGGVGWPLLSLAYLDPQSLDPQDLRGVADVRAYRGEIQGYPSEPRALRAKRVRFLARPFRGSACVELIAAGGNCDYRAAVVKVLHSFGTCPHQEVGHGGL
jgi:hypothetical protein